MTPSNKVYFYPRGLGPSILATGIQKSSLFSRVVNRFLFLSSKPFYGEVDLTKYPHRYGYRLTRVRDKISLKLDVCLFVVGSSLCREAHGKLPFVL